MNFHTERSFSLVRCLFGVAALTVTFTIVVGLDALSDRYSAATIAEAPVHAVVVAQR